MDAWQGSEYSSGSEYTRILNMPELDKVLKKILHYRCLAGFRLFLMFWIWPVLNMPGLHKALNKTLRYR